MATRANFNRDSYNEEELQRLKLEDGIQVHERAKVDLEVFAREQGQRIVKPFMLVSRKTPITRTGSKRSSRAPIFSKAATATA